MKKIIFALVLANLAWGCAGLMGGGGGGGGGGNEATAEATPSRANAPSDDSITTNVQNALRRDELLANTSIDVTTQQGVVTLKGRAPNARAANRAFSLARATEGVRRVISQLDWPAQ